jgi:hypothetical protein
VPDDPAPKRERDPETEAEIEIEADEESFLDDDGTTSDDTRHYLQDPSNLADNARDADEQAQDDLLDLDQTELDELGLTLDDPHQPDDE